MSCRWDKDSYNGRGGCIVNYDGKQSSRCYPYARWNDNKRATCRKREKPVVAKGHCTFDADAYGGLGGCRKGTKQSKECFPLQYHRRSDGTGMTRFPTCRRYSKDLTGYGMSGGFAEGYGPGDLPSSVRDEFGIQSESSWWDDEDDSPMIPSFTRPKGGAAIDSPRTRRRIRRAKMPTKLIDELSDIEDMNIDIFDDDDVPSDASVGDLIDFSSDDDVPVEELVDLSSGAGSGIIVSDGPGAEDLGDFWSIDAGNPMFTADVVEDKPFPEADIESMVLAEPEFENVADIEAMVSSKPKFEDKTLGTSFYLSAVSLMIPETEASFRERLVNVLTREQIDILNALVLPPRLDFPEERMSAHLLYNLAKSDYPLNYEQIENMLDLLTDEERALIMNEQAGKEIDTILRGYRSGIKP